MTWSLCPHFPRPSFFFFGKQSFVVCILSLEVIFSGVPQSCSPVSSPGLFLLCLLPPFYLFSTNPCSCVESQASFVSPCLISIHAQNFFLLFMPVFILRSRPLLHESLAPNCFYSPMVTLFGVFATPFSFRENNFAFFVLARHPDSFFCLPTTLPRFFLNSFSCSLPHFPPNSAPNRSLFLMLLKGSPSPYPLPCKFIGKMLLR